MLAFKASYTPHKATLFKSTYMTHMKPNITI